MDGTEMLEVNPVLEEVLKSGSFIRTSLCAVSRRKAPSRILRKSPEDIRRVFVSAHDILRRTISRCRRRSRTTLTTRFPNCKFPNSATVEEVAEAYKLAYRLGCKGVTIYPDGRDSQVLNLASKKSGDDEKAEEENSSGLSYVVVPRPRPDITWE